MTLGLACVPSFGLHCDSWRDSGFTSFPIQEKGLRMEAASCFRLLLPLATLNSMQQCWPRLVGLSGVFRKL